MGVAAELKKSGIVAAVKDEAAFRQALSSPARVIFLLKSDLMTVGDTVRRAHVSDKKNFTAYRSYGRYRQGRGRGQIRRGKA